MTEENKQEIEWKDKLDPEVYKITREKGTEIPFSGKYCNHKEDGKYVCSNCGKELFSSDSKFDSGSGWPSFDAPTNEASVILKQDDSFGMKRTEAVCNECGAHLGHVFDDGPKETTGKRFCVNSLSLDFKKENEQNK